MTNNELIARINALLVFEKPQSNTSTYKVWKIEDEEITGSLFGNQGTLSANLDGQNTLEEQFILTNKENERLRADFKKYTAFRIKERSGTKGLNFVKKWYAPGKYTKYGLVSKECNIYREGDNVIFNLKSCGWRITRPINDNEGKILINRRGS